MNSQFNKFLENLNLEENLKISIQDGFSVLFEELCGTSSATSYYIPSSGSDPDGSGSGGPPQPHPGGYNGGHATVFKDEEDFDANEGEENPFQFVLPKFVGKAETDVQDIKDKFKSFLNKLQGKSTDSLTEAIMSAIDVIFKK